MAAIEELGQDLTTHGETLARANPRHAETNRVAQRAGWPIVRTFDHAAPRYKEHPGVTARPGVGNVSDCRHWSACSAVLAQRSSAILEMLMA